MDTVEFFCEISIPLSFTAECAENAEALEKTSVDCNCNALKLCALAISAVINRCFLGSAIGMYACISKFDNSTTETGKDRINNKKKEKKYFCVFFCFISSTSITPI